VSGVGETTFLVSLELLDSADGATLLNQDGKCEVCNRKEANDYVSTAASELARRFEELRPKLALPQTSGGVSSEQRDRNPVAGAGQAEHSRGLKKLAIASWIGGGVSLLAGITLLGLNNTRHGFTADATGHIHVEQWDTLAPGITLTVLGAALAATGGILWWRDRASVSVSAGPSGGGLVIDGRW
jgi:hypothetical protein